MTAVADWDAVDLFAGPGGWDEGLRLLGVTRVLGFEKDETACATAGAAGHARRLGDLTMLSPLEYGPARGLVGSPPCPSFSTAGKGLGKLDMARIMAHIERIRRAGRWLHYSREGWHDDRSPLVLEPLRYALTLWPEWIALEQVPPVLPIWQAIATVLREHGYHVECGNLTAEQFGVAQTRKRAILAARRCSGFGCDHLAPLLPAPTHRRYRKGACRSEGDLSLREWVSMADALALDRDGDGWAMRSSAMANAAVRRLDEPAATIRAGHDRAERLWVRFGNQPNSAVRAADEPAATIRFGERMNACDWIVGQARNAGPGAQRAPRDLGSPSYTIRASGSGSHPSGVEWAIGHQAEAVRVSVQEAAVLQSFTAGYPWRGSPTKQYLQVGNAIPPLLAAAVAGQLLGVGWRHLAPAMWGDLEAAVADGAVA